jgi:hypothetical protein
MSEEEFGLRLRKFYFHAFRHGFFSCMAGSILFYLFVGV